jgi:hypothetical protein
MRTIGKIIRINFLIFASLLLFFNQVHAQTTCYAKAPSQVAVGQTFEYSITLNERPSKIASANFSNFSVVGGPSQGSSTSISSINGQTTQTSSYSYTYYLSADKTGNFTIPGTAFIVNGKQITSNSVKISVVEASKQQASGSNRGQSSGQSANSSPSLDKDEIMIKAFASKSNPYEGEEVIITHKLYIGPGVNGGYQVTSANMPSQSGLWSYQLGDTKADPPKSYETINGKQYLVLEIRQTAVYPQKSGKITITPLEMDMIARVIYQTRSSGSVWDQFFGGGQRAQDHKLNLKSNSITLNVKKLPTANRPDNFSGIVGDFSIKSSLSRSALKANDAANLIITITGKGNLQHIEQLNIKFPPDFDVTEPNITDNVNTRNGGVSGSRSFEYVMIPRSEGDFSIAPASFTYFDLSTQTYKTISSDSFNIKVAKGDGSGITTMQSNQKDIRILDKDIRFIKTSPNSFHKVVSPFFATPWYFTLILLPILLFVIFIIVWRKQIEANRDSVMTRDKKANKVARKRLKKANLLLNENNKEEFYIEISKVLWGYLSDKFHIPLSQLSMESVEARLKEKKLTEESVHEFLSTLHQCEFARFAPGDSSQLMKEMYELTSAFIINIEKKNK